MITHLKEVAGLLSLHFLSTPPIHILPYKLALRTKEQDRLNRGGKDTEESLMHDLQYVTHFSFTDRA